MPATLNNTTGIGVSESRDFANDGADRWLRPGSVGGESLYIMGGFANGITINVESLFTGVALV